MSNTFSKVFSGGGTVVLVDSGDQAAGVNYAIKPDGGLFWYKDTDRGGQNGAKAERGWAPGSGNQISFGWEKFRDVFAAGDGIFYAITFNGTLHWYQDTDREGRNGAQAARGWAPGSGNQISFGWEQFRHVFSSGVGFEETGHFYAITDDGKMRWYKDTDRSGNNGAQAERGWAPGSGNQISFGWEKFRHVFSGDGGIIYAITPEGTLHWYRDTDGRGQNGAQAERGWAPGSGNQISFGWEKFRHVFSGGGGIIYAIAPEGTLHWYRDTDRGGQNGAKAERGWAPGSGNQISFGW